jgi:hypothetical protein
MLKECTPINIQLSAIHLQAVYPVPFLFSGSLKFPAQTEEITKYYQHLPQLIAQKTMSDNGQRRVHLKLSLG